MTIKILTVEKYKAVFVFVRVFLSVRPKNYQNKPSTTNVRTF